VWNESKKPPDHVFVIGAETGRRSAIEGDWEGILKGAVAVRFVFWLVCTFRIEPGKKEGPVRRKPAVQRNLIELGRGRGLGQS